MAILTLDLGSFALQKGFFHDLKAYISQHESIHIRIL